MPTAVERSCCKKNPIVNGKIEAANLTCITEHEGFRVICLNVHVLELSFYDFVLKSGPPVEGETLHKYVIINFNIDPFISNIFTQIQQASLY